MSIRTVSIKLIPSAEQAKALAQVQRAFAEACNRISAAAAERKVWNRVALHHLVYYDLRSTSSLGSQMVCNAVKAVADSYKVRYKVRKPKRDSEIVPSVFRSTASVHYDKRTYSIKGKGEAVSLNTPSGRVVVLMRLGDFQRALLAVGVPKEAELLRRGKRWYFNLVLDIPDAKPADGTDVLGVDLGENVIAATSTGKLFGGGALRDKRDRHLALRSRLQAKGTESARQLLSKVSGRESRHMKHVNHEVARMIVTEAVRIGAGTVVLEDLTNIRQRIRAGKRVRTRLNRWAFAQLQSFVEYKAEGAGLKAVYANPAYTSKTCSSCGAHGTRDRHHFSCSGCGFQRHSDVNAASNLRGIGLSIGFPTGEVMRPFQSTLP